MKYLSRRRRPLLGPAPPTDELYDQLHAAGQRGDELLRECLRQLDQRRRLSQWATFALAIVAAFTAYALYLRYPAWPWPILAHFLDAFSLN